MSLVRIISASSRIQEVFVFTFLVTLCLLTSNASSLNPERLPKPEEWNWKSSEEIDVDDFDEHMDFIQKLITGIIAFVVVVVAVCLILCFCCPICVIAKMRQRRGQVIRTGPGTTTAVARPGQTVTVTVNRSAPPTSQVSSPPVVAIPNNYNAASKPYPVQESVTVVPLLQPQQPIQYPPHSQPMNMAYPPHSAPQYHPQNFELPPPYPGLARDDTTNLPYNPYYTGDDATPNAPPK